MDDRKTETRDTLVKSLKACIEGSKSACKRRCAYEKYGFACHEQLTKDALYYLEEDGNEKG